MPGKIKYYVGKLSLSQIPLSMKLSGTLVMSHLKSGLRMSSNNIICLLYQPGAAIDNRAGLRWWMFRRKQTESNKLPPTETDTTILNWASSRENLSSGFSSKRDSNQSPQLQR